MTLRRDLARRGETPPMSRIGRTEEQRDRQLPAPFDLNQW
jgi:hypothetical protein